MARYPFLPQGSIFLKLVLEKNGITVSDLIEAHWLEEVRARGRVRLLESVMHKEGVDSATTIDLSSDLGKMTEALSFLYAMLVVCASFNERLLARWVEGEASRADQLFGMDEENFDMAYFFMFLLSYFYALFQQPHICLNKEKSNLIFSQSHNYAQLRAEIPNLLLKI